MNKEIGTVVSTPDGPSPTTLEFVVNEGVVHRGQFVEMKYSEGIMIALVTDVYKTNRYFERAESVKEFEANGRKLFEQFPTHEWEYMLAKTRPLGVYNNDLLKRTTYPPSPGTRVKVAENDTLKKFLGFASEKGLKLGKIEYHDLDVTIPLSKMLRTHLAILAMSGAGKTVAAKVVMEELLNRKKEDGRIGIIIFDVHGEYNSFTEPVSNGTAKDYSAQSKLVKARDIKIGVPKLNVNLISTIIPGLSAPQKRELGRILERLRREMRDGAGPFDFSRIKAEIIKDEEIKEATSKVLLSWISSLEELNIFDKVDYPSVNDIVESGKITVVDMSDMIDMKKKQIIVAYFARKMFSERRMKRMPPYLMVLEEAHQFIPEGHSQERSISKGIMQTIAREGRKFGSSLCIISQRPIQLDTTTLSQCGTKLILRVTNPYDLDHIGKSAESLDKRSLDMITSLRVGEGLIVGEAVNYPLFFKVRKNDSQDSIHEVSLEQAAVDYENKRDNSDSETEEFL